MLTQKQRERFIKDCMSAKQNLSGLLKERQEMLKGVLTGWMSGKAQISMPKKPHYPGSHRTRIGYL